MTAEEVKQIPELLKTMKIKEVAKHFDVHERTINLWIKKLRREGVKIHLEKGRPALIIN